MTTLHRGRAPLLAAGAVLALAGCGSSGSADDVSAGSGASTTAMSGGIVATASVGGTPTLADATGHTLYSTSSESADHIRCVGMCTRFWKPVIATRQEAAHATSALGTPFGVAERPDGGTQLTYRDHPLYTFTQEGEGELHGDGFADAFAGTHFLWASALSDHASASAGAGDDESGEYGNSSGGGSGSSSGGSSGGGSGSGYSY